MTTYRTISFLPFLLNRDVTDYRVRLHFCLEQMSVTLSILIPIYSKYEHLNEGLEGLDTSLNAKSLTYEILLIDNTLNASLEGIVKQRTCLKIVKPDEPSTQQRSYFEGFRASQGEWVLLLDYDLLSQETIIDGMIEGIDEEYDVIRAIRQNRAYRNWLRFLGSKAANLVFNLGSTNKLQDIGSSLALLKREFYQAALRREYEKFHDFPLFILVVTPLKIKEIAVDASQDNTRSEYSFSKLAVLFLRMAWLKLDSMVRRWR